MTGENLEDTLIAAIMELTEAEAAELLRWWKETDENGRSPHENLDH